MTSDFKKDFKKYRAQLQADAAKLSGKPIETVIQNLHDRLIEALTGDRDPVYTAEEAEQALAYYVALTQQDPKESP